MFFYCGLSLLFFPLTLQAAIYKSVDINVAFSRLTTRYQRQKKEGKKKKGKWTGKRDEAEEIRTGDSSSKFIHLYLPGPNNETGYLSRETRVSPFLYFSFLLIFFSFSSLPPLCARAREPNIADEEYCARCFCVKPADIFILTRALRRLLSIHALEVCPKTRGEI